MTTRRTFITVAAGVVAVPTPAGFSSEVVDTAAGRVRGRRGAFLGIPYARADRFQPPQPATPWRGIRDATAFGHIAPQPAVAGRYDYAKLIDWFNQPGGPSEDCQVLNVWTPRPGAGRRPVLVSFHGGGFTSGSGNHAGFDGAELARRGDVVVVTVNHRLGVLGYLHTADLGGPAEWSTSGAGGMLDCVAALRWVRENIAGFGGDPSRVMVFGQSGGGAKTSTLLAMPSAAGLLHRAAVQSGSALTLTSREAATRTAQRFLTQLGLTPARVAELRDVPVAVLVAAQAALEAGSPPASFAPVVDGVAIPRDPFAPDAPETARNVPMIVSTTLDESTAFLTDVAMDEAALTAQVTTLVGAAAAARVLSAYRAAYPAIEPYRLYNRILTDRGQFRSANLQAERKAAQGGAPVYKYLFTWPSPADDGRWGAVHGVDVSLPFHRTDSEMHGFGAPRARQLAEELSGAWVRFARTGDPNGGGLTAWPAYTAQRRATLVLGEDTRVVDDPLRDLRLLWAELSG